MRFRWESSLGHESLSEKAAPASGRTGKGVQVIASPALARRAAHTHRQAYGGLPAPPGRGRHQPARVPAARGAHSNSCRLPCSCPACSCPPARTLGPKTRRPIIMGYIGRRRTLFELTLSAAKSSKVPSVPDLDRIPERHRGNVRPFGIQHNDPMAKDQMTMFPD